MSKFKVGDEVKITASIHGHTYPVGLPVTIVEAHVANGFINHWPNGNAWRTSRGFWWVGEDEIEMNSYIPDVDCIFA